MFSLCLSVHRGGGDGVSAHWSPVSGPRSLLGKEQGGEGGVVSGSKFLSSGRECLGTPPLPPPSMARTGYPSPLPQP